VDVEQKFMYKNVTQHTQHGCADILA